MTLQWKHRVLTTGPPGKCLEVGSYVSDSFTQRISVKEARILLWVAFPFSGGSSQPRDQTQVSRIASEFFIS